MSKKFSIFKNYKNKTGVTLIELLVVFFIILLLSAIVLLNYDAMSSKFALERSAQKLAQSIRKAQEMAMSAKEWEGEIPKGGYGIHLGKIFYPSGILYADKNGDEQYDATNDKIVGTISLESGVKVYRWDTEENLLAIDINFKPPAPTVKITELGLYGPEIKDSTTITIALSSDITETRTINVNKAGRVEITNP